MKVLLAAVALICLTHEHVSAVRCIRPMVCIVWAYCYPPRPIPPWFDLEAHCCVRCGYRGRGPRDLEFLAQQPSAQPLPAPQGKRPDIDVTAINSAANGLHRQHLFANEKLSKIVSREDSEFKEDSTTDFTLTGQGKGSVHPDDKRRQRPDGTETPTVKRAEKETEGPQSTTQPVHELYQSDKSQGDGDNNGVAES